MHSYIFIVIALLATQCAKTDSVASEEIFDLANKPVTSETRIHFEKIEFNTVVLDAIENNSVAVGEATYKRVSDIIDDIQF
jgi:hypothetical protein